MLLEALIIGIAGSALSSKKQSNSQPKPKSYNQPNYTRQINEAWHKEMKHAVQDQLKRK